MTVTNADEYGKLELRLYSAFLEFHISRSRFSPTPVDSAELAVASRRQPTHIG